MAGTSWKVAVDDRENTKNKEIGNEDRKLQDRGKAGQATHEQSRGKMEALEQDEDPSFCLEPFKGESRVY